MSREVDAMLLFKVAKAIASDGRRLSEWDCDDVCPPELLKPAIEELVRLALPVETATVPRRGADNGEVDVFYFTRMCNCLVGIHMFVTGLFTNDPSMVGKYDLPRSVIDNVG